MVSIKTSCFIPKERVKEEIIRKRMKMEKASDQYFLGYKINYKWGGGQIYTPPPVEGIGFK